MRERQNDFVMIEQHEHAKLSGNLFRLLQDKYAPSETFSPAIQYAIFNHDCGWIPFDKTPFWNDEQNSPYSFINFPTATKAILYAYGINQVSEQNVYAALLCSEHYQRFLQDHSTPEALQFIEKEQRRAKEIKTKLQKFDEKLFLSHYELLQFFDNLSLFVCLNEPGSTKENEHPFFKHGIKLPSAIGEHLLIQWNGEDQIMINKDIFKQQDTLFLKQKIVEKKNISTNGIQKAFNSTTYNTISITFKTIH